MTQIFPFRAWRYSRKAGPIDTLVTQPYDKITAELQENYYRASPYNIVRLIKRKEESTGKTTGSIYKEAAETLKSWTAQKILEQDDQPSFYAYFQKFRHPDSSDVITRKGFIGLLQLENYSSSIVHRHELTHSGPKLDRLELTRHTHAHFGQLFMLYDDPKAAVDRLLDQVAVELPLISLEDEFGTTHRIWRICRSSNMAEIQASMLDKKLMIADGHHRYETALTYSRENPCLSGANRVMMTFVNMRTPGLVVLATHRVFDSLPTFDRSNLLLRLNNHFEVQSFEDIETFHRHMNEVPVDKIAIGVVFIEDPRHYLLTEKNTVEDLQARSSDATKHLDVSVLHRLIIEHLMGIPPNDVRELKHIRYIRGLRAAVEEVRSRRAQVAFLLRPVGAEKVAKISFSGGVMPQKSTDFYPKLQTGLTIYRFG